MRPATDSYENVLLNIHLDKLNLTITEYDPYENAKYQPKQNTTITTVSMINNVLYLGEINPTTKQNYLTINKKQIPVDDVVSLIYPFGDTVHFLSNASVFNGQKPQEYLLKSNNEVTKIQGSKINLYSE
jgi:hypothetical protein